MTTHPTPTSALTLVIGGNGKTGRRVADRLLVAGHGVRRASRSTTPAFDWYRPETWDAALDGVHAAYVTFQPDLAVRGSVDIIGAFGAAARAHGLARLVLLSGRGEPEAQACERVLLDCGVETTVVRGSFFAQNFSEHLLLGPVLDGVIALPAGNVVEPIVDADDIAEVVVVALTEPGHGGRVHELTGPRLLSFHEVAAELRAATGREVVYQPVTPAEYATAAVAAGVPAAEAEMLAGLFGHIFDGHNASLATGVSEVLGRPARDFADFARSAAAAGVWG
jgi:uncharacterized protein YbjT (DUF2867 family)